MNTIRIVYVAPGQPAEIREVEDSLECFQALVGGFLECMCLPVEMQLPTGVSCRMDYDLLGDEEGRLKWDFSLDAKPEEQRIQPNRWVLGQDILGPFIITRADAEGDWIDLTPEEAARLVKLVNTQMRPVQPDDVREPRIWLTDFDGNPIGDTP